MGRPNIPDITVYVVSICLLITIVGGNGDATNATEVGNDNQSLKDISTITTTGLPTATTVKVPSRICQPNNLRPFGCPLNWTIPIQPGQPFSYTGKIFDIGRKKIPISEYQTIEGLHFTYQYDWRGDYSITYVHVNGIVNSTDERYIPFRLYTNGTFDVRIMFVQEHVQNALYLFTQETYDITVTQRRNELITTAAPNMTYMYVEANKNRNPNFEIHTINESLYLQAISTVAGKHFLFLYVTDYQPFDYCLLIVTIQDVNECALGICNVNADCTNTPGSFTCQCRSGYSGDGVICIEFTSVTPEQIQEVTKGGTTIRGTTTLGHPLQPVSDSRTTTQGHPLQPVSDSRTTTQGHPLKPVSDSRTTTLGHPLQPVSDSRTTTQGHPLKPVSDSRTTTLGHPLQPVSDSRTTTQGHPLKPVSDSRATTQGHPLQPVSDTRSFGLISFKYHCPLLVSDVKKTPFRYHVSINSGSFTTNPYFNMNHSHITVCEYAWENGMHWPDGKFCVFRGRSDSCPASSNSVESGVETRGSDVETPGSGVETPGSDVETPGSGVEAPGSGIETPGSGIETPGSDVETRGSVVFRADQCCTSNEDYNTPVTWPFGKDQFCILPYYKNMCQKMRELKSSFRNISFEIETLSNSNFLRSTEPMNIVEETDNVYFLQLCCYEKKESDTPAIDTPGLTGAASAVVASVFGTVGIIALFVGLCCLWKHRKRRLIGRRLRNDNLNNLGTELSPKEGKPGLEIGSLLKMILDPESQMTIYGMLIHPDKIEKLDQIGKGAFGTVFYGRYKPDKNPLHAQEVAIKTLKDNCIYPEISAFMEEAMIMADFSHPNVLNILGICVDPSLDTPALVLPFMQHGDLQKYLRKFRFDEDNMDKTPELIQLLSFCLHIARGMEYLSNMKFVHRDLAARNCMLNSQLLVKVADFGLTRDIYSSSYYRQDKNKLLPIKWMAIESLQDRVFSVYTDVWSYGVTLWEIFTLGKTPYPNLDNPDVLLALEKGQRLPNPDTCPDKLFEIILQCWVVNPKERPTFTEVVKVLEEALSGLGDYLDLDGESAGKVIDLTAGVVSSPRDFAHTESELAVMKLGEMSYADYRKKENVLE